ncbi:MAG: UvrB/UvrC motif-containing protein [Planctomycetota bacterium]|jgi:excinuclease ABC subunit C
MTMRERLKAKADRFPKAPGVYVMLGAGGEELYVGKAGSLRERVRSYFQPPERLDVKTRALVSHVKDVKFIETASEVEALVLEARLIKDLQPRYNVRLKANQHYPFVEVPWADDFPHPRITRALGARGSKYYGPFVDTKGLRRAMPILRRVFRFCQCSRRISAGDEKRRFNRPCVDHFIGLCSGPCAGRITKAAYRRDLRRLEMFLRGRKTELVEELRSGMKEAAAALDYEEAARLRDELMAVESLDRRGSLADGIEPAPPAIDPKQAARVLGEILGRAGPAVTIEGIDLANLGGQDAVGSVVTFANGAPAKGGYRRFSIRGEATRDDYAMMREVVRRRYRRLLREGKSLPDVILLDGGLGHMREVEKELAVLGLAGRGAGPEGDESGPVLAAISKSPDTAGRRRKRGSLKRARAPDTVRTLARTRGVKFPRGSAALKLLQFVRDEAHRFAQHYLHMRQRKRVLGEDHRRPRKK